jgi:hypothetical protein
MSAMLLLEKLNLLQFLTPEVQLRGSDEAMQELKGVAVVNRHVIKNYLNVTISEKLTPIAIAQKLLNKIDLRLSYVGRLGPRGHRESVYKFVAPDDGRDCILGRWFSRDEQSNCESVSVTNNINVPIQCADTPLPSNPPANIIRDNNCGGMDGQQNPTDSLWQQVKYSASLAIERVGRGVEAVKEFLSTLTSDERWGVMVAIDEAQPNMFEQLVDETPDWVQWLE